MKKKEKRIPKLRLSRETLRELTRPDTRKAEGGGQASKGVEDQSCESSVPTCCTTDGPVT
jgi:hypothetical protein